MSVCPCCSFLHAIKLHQTLRQPHLRPGSGPCFTRGWQPAKPSQRQLLGARPEPRLQLPSPFLTWLFPWIPPPPGLRSKGTKQLSTRGSIQPQPSTRGGRESTRPWEGRAHTDLRGAWHSLCQL